MKYPISDKISDFLDIRIRFSIFPIRTEPYPNFYYPTISVFDFLISAHLLLLTNYLSQELKSIFRFNFILTRWTWLIGNGIQIISLYLDLNFIAWLLNNRSSKSRLFRQFFFHVWHIFSSLKFLQILPQSSIQLALLLSS